MIFSKHFIRAFVSVSVYLATAVAHADWTGRQDLHRIYTAASTVYIQTQPSSAHINPENCSSSSNYAMDPAALLFEERYQMLLTALASGKQVSLEINGCHGSYPKLTKVIVYK